MLAVTLSFDRYSGLAMNAAHSCREDGCLDRINFVCPRAGLLAGHWRSSR
jgi:hypothetical protein